MRELTDEERDALSLERIELARETLTAALVAFLGGAPGAVEGDPAGAVVEAKRHLTGLVASMYGREAWAKMVAGG